MMNFFKKNFYFSNVRKSYRTLTAVSVLGLGLGLSACSEDTKTAGGGPSGTEAGNAITAQILTADAKPAVQARVKIIDSESIEGSNGAYTAVADENGKVTIENVASGNYTLEASLEGTALQVNIDVISGNEDFGSAKLGKTATVSGKVDGSSGTIKVRGMDHSAPVVDGSFNMDSLPAGPLSLVFVPDQSGDTTSAYVKAGEGSKIEAASFANESVYLLLDDFQDSNYQNRFMPAHVYDGGWWYFDYDSISVDAVVNFKGHLPVLENDEGNISAHVAAKLGEFYIDDNGVEHWPWAVVGVELGKSDKKLCNDISSVDSIAFMTKGSGNIIFTLLDESKEGSSEILTYEFSAPPEWTRYSLPLKELVFPGHTLSCVNQLAWKLASPSVPPTVDEPSPAIDFWIDDIQLIGGDRQSIWEK